MLNAEERKLYKKKAVFLLKGSKIPITCPRAKRPNHAITMSLICIHRAIWLKNMSKPQLNTSLSKLFLGVVELANGNVALDLLTQPAAAAEVKLGREFQTRCPL